MPGLSVSRLGASFSDRSAAVQLYEPGGNLLTDPNDFSAWTVDSAGAGSSNPVVTPNVASGPDGAMNADRIQFTRDASGFSRIQRGFASVPGVTYRNGIWLRAPVQGPGPAQLLVSTPAGPIGLGTTWQRFSIEDQATGTSMAAALIIWSEIPGSPLVADIYAAHAQVRALP